MKKNKKEIILKHHPLMLEQEGNRIYSWRGETVLGFRITYPEKYSQSRDDFERIHGDWNRALGMLPAGSVAVKSDWYERENLHIPTPEPSSYLERATAAYFEGREHTRHTGYLFLVLSAKVDFWRKARNPFNIPSIRSMQRQDSQVREFLEAVGQMREMLARNGFIFLEEMDERELYAYQRIWFSAFNREFTINIDFEGDFVDACERKVGVISLGSETDFPQSVDTERVDAAFSSAADNFVFHQGMMDDLGLTLGFSHVYNQIVFIDEHKVHVRDLEDRRLALYGARRFSSQNRYGADQMQGYLDELAQDQGARLVRGHSNVIYWGDTAQEFEDAGRIIQARLRALDFVPHRAKGRELQNLYVNSFPLNVTYLGAGQLYLVDLAVATALFVNNTNYRNADTGVLLSERLFNTPVRFDFWDADKKLITSRNFAMVAPTGKGKSFTANHIFRQLIEQGITVVIIDLGDSYLKLSKLLPSHETMLFRYKCGQPLGLNPFALEGEKPDSIKIEELCEFVWTLVKRGEEPSDAERTSLRKIVAHYYSSVDENHSWPSFYDFVDLNGEMLYSQLFIEDRSYFDLKEFLHVGSDFIGEGLYANLFRDAADQSASFKDKKLIVFELDEIKENRLLLSIMLQVISEAIQKTVWADRKNRGIVFFDEFAKQLEFPEVTRRVKYYSQAIRKQNGGVGIVLQTLNQLPDTPEGRSILDNTETFIFLESNNHADSIERLKLSEHDRSQLYSLRRKFEGERRYSEVYVKRGSYGNVFRIEVAPEVFLAYQTEGEVHTRIMELYEEKGSMEQAIEAYKKETR